MQATDYYSGSANSRPGSQFSSAPDDLKPEGLAPERHFTCQYILVPTQMALEAMELLPITLPLVGI